MTTSPFDTATPRVTPEKAPKVERKRKTKRFLSRTEVAHRLGLVGTCSLTRARLPEPDAVIGDRKGWLPSTVDEWARDRPGSGRWGPR